ncbi:CoA-binding protein [Desulfitibacter alkalitolerans]|uniref:CoA-binding protein n=1 Tax=Desulfitibacter alkalitolerans TaxID=264641 RepID=UPI0009FDF822|nr:CoA-binding protein [Desulfitibacter alkalitolerans]
MSSKSIVVDFISQQSLAVVGVSSTGKKFSNRVYKDLKAKGYNVYPVNPKADEIDGNKCYKSIEELPQSVDSLLILLPPKQTEKVVKEAVAAGIKRIWMQQGAETKEAIDYCRENNVKVIHNECILMFVEPVTFPHNFHRYIWKLIGKEPK